MSTKDSLADDGDDKRAGIAAIDPFLFYFPFYRFTSFRPRLNATQIKFDALVVRLAGIDPLQYGAIAFYQPVCIHVRKEVHCLSSVVAVP